MYRIWMEEWGSMMEDDTRVAVERMGSGMINECVGGGKWGKEMDGWRYGCV